MLLLARFGPNIICRGGEEEREQEKKKERKGLGSPRVRGQTKDWGTCYCLGELGKRVFVGPPDGIMTRSKGRGTQSGPASVTKGVLRMYRGLGKSLREEQISRSFQGGSRPGQWAAATSVGSAEGFEHVQEFH